MRQDCSAWRWYCNHTAGIRSAAPPGPITQPGRADPGTAMVTLAAGSAVREGQNGLAACNLLVLLGFMQQASF
jgi:hypothetical protein